MMDGSDEETSTRMKRMMIICDSMTHAELESDGSPFIVYENEKDKSKPVDVNVKRLVQIAKGSGATVREVEEMLCQYRMMSNMAKSVGGKGGWLQNMQKVQQAANAAGVGRGLGPNGMPTAAQISQIQRSLPPGVLQQMRQSGGGVQEMMKAMMGGASDTEVAEMQQMMQQMAGGLGSMGGMGGMLQSMMGGGRGR